MESVLDAAPPRADAAPPRAARVTLPWTLSAAVLGSTSILVGLLWDISWHATIGRDTFWTPAHLAIYLGGLLAGLSAGWLALTTTFRSSSTFSTPAETVEPRAATVRFWGFRAPLGAWVSIWGAFAMLTSAPFDDWWHDAYGLDVKIISPPHVVLAAGILAVAFGVMLQAVSVQNRSAGAAGGSERTFGLIYTYTASLALLAVATLFLEYSEPNLQHGTRFYEISCAAYPMLLAAAGRAGRLRWPATATATLYTAVKLAIIWILPLFPAQPRLAPIFNPVSHMWPPFFPLLLVVPAFAFDLLLHRFDRAGARRSWWLALALAASFLALFLAVQWFFAEFMLTPAARNWFFAADQWTYRTRPGEWHRQFWTAGDPLTPAAASFALLLATVSARIGIAWGAWMSRVRR